MLEKSISPFVIELGGVHFTNFHESKLSFVLHHHLVFHNSLVQNSGYYESCYFDRSVFVIDHQFSPLFIVILVLLIEFHSLLILLCYRECPFSMNLILIIEFQFLSIFIFYGSHPFVSDPLNNYFQSHAFATYPW